MSFTFLKNLIEFLVSEEWFVNMRFTRRDMKMIEYLRDYEVVELKAMSEYLGVSVKTLKNQLKELSETLKEFGVDVQFVSSNQILVKGHEKFAEVMSVSIPRFEMEFERRFLLLLVLHDNFLTIQEIADELLVSKSYAEKHLAAIMKKYPEDIQAQRHYGIRYAASQNKRREVFVKILFPYLFGEDYIVALEQFDNLHFPLFHYFTKEQMFRTRGAIQALQRLEWFQLTDESLQQLSFIFCFSRVMQTVRIQKSRLRYRRILLIRRNLTDCMNGYLDGVRNFVCRILKKNCDICIHYCYRYVNKKSPVRTRLWIRCGIRLRRFLKESARDSVQISARTKI